MMANKKWLWIGGSGLLILVIISLISVTNWMQASLFGGEDTTPSEGLSSVVYDNVGLENPLVTRLSLTKSRYQTGEKPNGELSITNPGTNDVALRFNLIIVTAGRDKKYQKDYALVPGANQMSYERLYNFMTDQPLSAVSAMDNGAVTLRFYLDAANISWHSSTVELTYSQGGASNPFNADNGSTEETYTSEAAPTPYTEEAAVKETGHSNEISVPTSQPATETGDLNGDGVVDFVDANMLYDYVKKGFAYVVQKYQYTGTEAQFKKSGDINADGKVNSTDVEQLFKMV